MAEPLSFASYRTAKAPPPLPTPDRPLPPGVTGRLPFRSGAVLQYATADDRAALAKLGIGPDDPVPDNLAAEMARAIAEEVAGARHVEGLTPVAPDTPPLREPATVMIDRLPAAKQAELRASIAEWTAGFKAELTQAEELAAVKPGLREAVRVAAEPMPMPGVSTHPLPTAPGPAPAPAAPSSAEGTPGAPADAGASLPTTHCPRCGCDIEHYDPVMPTLEDKYAYLTMLLGGVKARFRKDVPLFGGAVTVTFRTLTAPEAQLAMEQVRVDGLRAPFAGQESYFKRVMDYRLTLSVDRVAFRGRGATAIPTATATATDEAPGAGVALPEVLGWLRDEVLASEALVHATFEAFQQFQRLVMALEEKAEDPDFWAGIAAPR